MSEETVELVRSVLPRPDTDIIALFTDDSPSGELMQAMAPSLDPDFVAVKHVRGAAPDTARGPQGLRPAGLTGPLRGRATARRSRR